MQQQGKFFTFFAGLLIPVFILVAIVQVVMNDMKMGAIWSIYTLIFTVAGALVGTILEARMKPKPKKGFNQK